MDDDTKALIGLGLLIVIMIFIQWVWEKINNDRNGGDDQ
jgi:hypothetical protein